MKDFSTEAWHLEVVTLFLDCVAPLCGSAEGITDTEYGFTYTCNLEDSDDRESHLTEHKRTQYHFESGKT